MHTIPPQMLVECFFQNLGKSRRNRRGSGVESEDGKSNRGVRTQKIDNPDYVPDDDRHNCRCCRRDDDVGGCAKGAIGMRNIPRLVAVRHLNRSTKNNERHAQYAEQQTESAVRSPGEGRAQHSYEYNAVSPELVKSIERY